MATRRSKNTRLQRLRRQARLFPRQFWLLAGGTFFYLAVSALAFPYTAILIKGRLGVSLAVVGAIMGGTALAGLPLQLVAGSASDRFGRRAVMIVCAACEALMYGGLAFVHGIVPICLLVFCDRALGWPMFLTASNAMVADLVRPRLRPEGYGLVRLMIGAGEVVGPLVAAALLLAGFALRDLFALAGAGCFVYLCYTLFFLHETRPARPRRQRAGPQEDEATEAFGSPALTALRRRSRARRRGKGSDRTGYAQVLRDRRFLAFCAVSLLPLFCFGQLYASLPLLVTGYLHIAPATWGLLMSLSALVIVVAQYPSVRAAKRLDPMFGVAAASLLFGLGVGLVAFLPASWPLLVAIVMFSLAQALFGPVTSTIVAGLATVDLRGRYMGAWTLVWIAGQGSLGPILGGVLLDGLGPHTSYGLIIACGLVGAGLYMLLRAPRRAGESTRLASWRGARS
jgi:MFS family permease